ncbi:UMP kinase [Candidatus Woesearchaeota archaeon]|nr:UMP kinase [Candidatus Woesearchaeota archaeon]
MPKTIILSLGGSLIAPEKIDINFLKNFKKSVEKYVKKNCRFVIVCGGGSIARKFQKAASKKKNIAVRDLDWLGIYATMINANFVKQVFGNTAEKNIIQNPTKKISSNKKIILASGWKPGWSTDYDAVLLARNLGARTVINMSNIDFVYDKDPKKYKNARKIKNVCWRHYRKLIAKKWTAGLNAPFDPIAAREADKLKLKVIIIGKNLGNFENLLDNKGFNGTIVENC